MRTPAAALALAALLLPTPRPAAAQEEPRIVRVLATTTDLAALVREVGGDAVRVDCLTRGPEDPHFLEARPSFVRLARDADLLVKTGVDLEAGYEVPLVRDSRNPRIQPGAPGHCDASAGIDLLDVPTGVVDRSAGDVHALGNPHFLLDPVRGAAASRTIAAALGRVDPPRAERYGKAAEAFALRVDEALFGKDLLAEAPARRLGRLLADGRLAAWAKERGCEAKVGGWARGMAPLAGRKAVAYHGTFAYLADRFGFRIVAHLEPKPGIPPSPRHVRTVADAMKADGVRAILRTVFQPRDVPDALAAETGGAVAVLAHMPGALEGTDGYIPWVDANVRALAAVLGEGK